MRRLRDEPSDDDDNDIPLHHKKPFGAGLKRKRVEFVQARETENGAGAFNKTTSGSAVGDLYASIVLGNRNPKAISASVARSGTPQAESTNNNNNTESTNCAVCSLPVTTSIKDHEASVAHQVRMPHVHPPSALDRSRMGLRTLATHGWDLDARRGLGREGEGARYPIMAKAKDGRLGIGAIVLEKPIKEPLPQRLTGKELKVAVAQDRQRTKRLQAEIYGTLDVEGYLNRTMDE